MATLYLAGFDGFYQDGAARGKTLQALCAEYGFDAWFPFDKAAPDGLAGRALAEWIYASNLAMIREADAVLANVNNFRGAEPDSGTAFEIGFAAALGKPVWAYMDEAGTLVDQLRYPENSDKAGVAIDRDGFVVEDFGLPRNLMLACAATVVAGSVRDCLERMRGPGACGQ
ncbi:nucleoside 2-deoxyribosyltransferase [Chitinasiproducens palmae]|uniref:Nucleoside 2-deoxyribosyltransferase n=1 Tax=Chitinasiproducens palmae TaxID=1770053 RepID=A0A1H2PT06_9BURK|nr:nucleoside 2-deoxyribosyltransferase [Chitinasiproducens palmae]SDV50166.1 Nucleoside 2-deoxyribosyltransferase [Chitinasiproducens palmae]